MRFTGMRKIIASVMATAVFFLAGNFAFADTNNTRVEAFVNSLYEDCLGRSADRAGLNDWCNLLASGEITGKQAAYGFFFSSEFIEKANQWSDDQLIEAYYRVFLGRGSDSSGLAYWRGKIADTTNDVSILFTGFADSAEFASKCASYGITVGSHMNVPVTIRGASSGSSSGSVSNGGYNATSEQALDEYWTSRGYEIVYIDLGNGNTQKCYAKFDDMTAHNDQVNAWRIQNGLPSLTVINDPNDARYQWARTRSVEVAYQFSHRTPYSHALGTHYDPREPSGNLGENIFGGDVYSGLCENGVIGGFEAFRTSAIHNAAMLDNMATAMVTASCSVLFVNPDGVSLSYASPSTGYGDSTVQLFY